MIIDVHPTRQKSDKTPQHMSSVNYHSSLTTPTCTCTYVHFVIIAAQWVVYIRVSPTAATHIIISTCLIQLAV